MPRDLGDGKPCPRPLGSDRYPEGIPDLPMADQLRVFKDRAPGLGRPGGSVRENLLRRLLTGS